MFDQQFRRRSMNATASSADITPRPIVVASSAGCRRMCPPSIGRAPTRHALRPSPAASGAGLGPSSSLRASDASDLRGGDERDPIALVRIAVRPYAVGDRRLGPDPPLAPAQLHQSDVAQLRRRRVRRWRRGRDHLVLVGHTAVPASKPWATPRSRRRLPQPGSCRPLLGRPCRRCRGARRAVVPAREAGGQPGRWAVESDRRLGPNGAPQPPAPCLMSGQPTCSATLGRPAAATPVAARTWLAADSVSSGSRPERRGRSTGAWRSAPPL